MPFTVIILLFLMGIFLLMYTGTTRLTLDQLKSIRLDQLRNAQLDPGHNTHPIVKTGHIAVPDYFESTPAGYRYLGGVYGGGWEVGEAYSLEELKTIKYSTEDSHSFLTLRMDENNIYVNIDRGDESAVRNFLKAMDQQQQSEFDTLILDFRFLQSIDFGAVIRLFNQIAPQRQIIFGTIINAYQEETIKSSGKPFFAAGRTLLLVDSLMPLPLKKLIRVLSLAPDYQVVGDIGTIPDTVCLKSEYEIGTETYRICTEKLTTGDAGIPVNNSGMSMTRNTTLAEMANMDKSWYKARDTAAIKNQLSGFLKSILSQ